MASPKTKKGGTKPGAGKPKKVKTVLESTKAKIQKYAGELALEFGEPIEKAILRLVYQKDTQDSVKASIWKSYLDSMVSKTTEQKMEKGLSKLMKRVLKQAYGKHIKELPLTNRDVLIEIYGFIPLVDPKNVSRNALIFDRHAIGIRRYNAGSVSTARVFGRLRDRGLINWNHHYGITLTPDGIRVAKRLNSRPH